MPYEHELASKVSHIDIVKNPEVADFLSRCSYLTEPSDEECQSIADRFVTPPAFVQEPLPRYVIAVDGSRHESSINDRLPSSKVGYIKISSVLIDMDEFSSLRVQNGRFVDPFRVAKLMRSNEPITLTLPSANVIVNGNETVQASFRAELDSQFISKKTRWDENNYQTSLRSTLFHLAAMRSGEMGTADPMRLILHRCPICEQPHVTVKDIEEPQHCPNCNKEVYPTDCLRVWEVVSDYQSNIEALTRIMNIAEQLMPIHYLRYIEEKSLPSLSGTAFFIDGPLAVFGNAAWLHSCIMRFFADVNKRLASIHQAGVLIIGLQKTGQVVDYLHMIDRFLPNNCLLALDDEFRYKYVLIGNEPSGNGFGSETYYGQDFLFKTPTGRTFVFGLPYPFTSKSPQVSTPFIEVKVDLARYSELARALKLITHLECDLYEDAVIPIALAHHYTAISLVPGGRVLDLITKKALDRRITS